MKRSSSAPTLWSNNFTLLTVATMTYTVLNVVMTSVAAVLYNALLVVWRNRAHVAPLFDPAPSSES